MDGLFGILCVLLGIGCIALGGIGLITCLFTWSATGLLGSFLIFVLGLVLGTCGVGILE
jgi:hypothetical protein